MSDNRIADLEHLAEELTIERDQLLAEVACWRNSQPDWKFSPRQNCLYCVGLGVYDEP
jgi:hypothetical protein